LLGQAYEREGKRKEALDIYTDCVPLTGVAKADATKVLVMVGRAALLLAMTDDALAKDYKRIPTARKDAERAIQLLKDTNLDVRTEAYAYGTSGIAHAMAATVASGAENASLRDTAKQHLEKALQLDPDHVTSWQWRVSLALEYKQRGDKEKAKELLRAARQKVQDPAVRARIDDLLRELG